MKKIILILFSTISLTCLAPGYMTLYIAMPEHSVKQFTLAEKIQAIILTETSNGTDRYNPNEVESVGLLQIRPVMIREVNRILGYNKYQLSDRLSDKKSIEIFEVFQNHVNPSGNFEVMCRTWNGGGRGMQKTSTLKYYDRALKNLNS
jgi:hypothetical protein